MRFFARSLQFLGLTLLPVAVLMELSGALGRGRGVADMLIMMLVGAGAFYLGWMMEGYASGKST